jgi:hypothetical protein
MGLTTTSVPYGRAAYDELRAIVHAAKADDPLAQVTLLVPTERVGVAARRALARGVTPGRPGIAGLSALTLRRLGEQLAGPALAAQGRRPLTAPVLATAVRAVLDAAPSAFAHVTTHAGTVAGLAGAHRELRELRPHQLDALRGHSALVDDVLRISAALSATTEGRWFDQVDLLRAATRRLHDDPSALTDTGIVIGVLLHDLDAGELDLLNALAARAPVHLLAGTSHETTADRVLHASDPDDEVRAVGREVAAALRAGTPGHRIAVLHGATDPYARLLHEHLADAGVAVEGRGAVPTAERTLGRTLLGLLALPDRGFRRDELSVVLDDAPVRWRGRRAPTAAWQRASRDAAVVGGGTGSDWGRLLTTAARQRDQASEEEQGAEPRTWLVDRDRRAAAHAEDLHAFIADLRSRLAAIDAALTWQHAAEALQALWHEVLGGDELAGWPEAELRAAERVQAVAASLAGLDAVGGPPPDLAAVRQVLELDLADDLGRVGRTGTGVHLGPLVDGVGLDVDLLVVVVGAAEGLLPARRRDDPLLPDAVRALPGGALPTGAERLERQHGQLLAALAGARTRLATFPRGDQRRTGERLPSRWLLPTLRALTGDPALQAGSWHAACAGTPTVHEVSSHAAAAEGNPVLAGEREWRRRAVLAALLTDADDVPLAAARALRSARRGSSFTRFHGNLTGVAGLPDPTAGSPVPPTALAAWTACPHHYFVHRLLGVSPVEALEDLLRIDPRESGSLVHEVLERFLQRVATPAPHEAWGETEAAVLDEVFDEVAAEYEATGATGFDRLWQHDRRGLRADVRAWLAHDSARRAAGGWTPVETEFPFGHQGGPEVPLVLPDGRKVPLKGTADRIDEAPDGSLLVVDYKTGAATYYSGLCGADLTDAGRKLQLPVYALAARARTGRNEAPVRAEYWFTSRRGGYQAVGYDVTDAVLDETARVVGVIVDGIAGGVFPARPKTSSGAYDCETCRPYGRTEAAVERRWALTYDDPALAAYRQLIDPAPTAQEAP